MKRAILAGALLSLALAAAAAQYEPAALLAAPTIGTCGTTPSITGTGRAGVATVGTGTVTACTVTFNATLGVAPSCLATSSSATIHVGVTAVSATAFTVGFSASCPSCKVYYRCEMY